ncbi:MAG: AAA family ATPase [Flavobacterium sp.]
MSTILVSSVFKTVGIPTVTYVQRNNGQHEKDLSNFLDISGKVCLITGPSKTGKSTLYQKVLKQKKREPLIIACDNEMSVEDFWRKALEEVNFERIISKSKTGQISGTGTFKIGANIGWSWLAKLVGEASLGLTGGESNTKVREKILSRPSAKHLIPLLQNLPYILVIEDFHYLNELVKESLFQQWKAFTDNEVSLIILGTTHHAIDLAYSNRDLIGRIIHLEQGTWDVEDLKKIVNQGFNELKIKIDPKLVKLIAEESVGLPLITQSICLRLFLDKGKANIDPKKDGGLIFVKEDLLLTLHNVAKIEFGIFHDIYDILATGFRKGARKYNTYELLLLSFTIDPVTFKLKRFEIDERLQQLKDISIPPAASINSTLGVLSKLQKRNQFELLEWSTKQSTLYILEPSFLFYLRWKNEREKVRLNEKYFDDFLRLFEVQISNLKISNVKVK